MNTVTLKHFEAALAAGGTTRIPYWMWLHPYAAQGEVIAKLYPGS